MRRIFYILFLFLSIFGNSFAKPTEIDTSKPVKIEADEVKIKKNNNSMIFKGNVRAIQENLNMFSDLMNVTYYKDKEDRVLIKTIVAKNNVVLQNENITAKGDGAIYDFQRQLITLKGNIILNEKDAVVFGEMLTYNITTKETKMNVIENEEANTNKKRVIVILDNINDLKDRYDKK